MAGFESDNLVTGLYDRGFLKFGGPREFQLNSERRSCVYFKPDGIASFVDGLEGVNGRPMDASRQREIFHLAVSGLAEAVDYVRRPHQHLFGMPQSMTALGMAVALQRGESYIWQRVDDGKSNGVRSRLAGDYNNGDRAIALDNALTTGGEFLRTSVTIRSDAVGDMFKPLLYFPGLVVLLDRQEGGKQTVEERKYGVASAFTLHDALTILYCNGRIGGREVANVQAEHQLLADNGVQTTLGPISV